MKASEMKRWKNSLVQKSRPLQEIAKANFSLCELKILDIYLARINSHNPYMNTVVLGKGEIEKILGVDRIRKDELTKRLTKLFTPITINNWVDDNGNEGANLLCLFEEVAMKKIGGEWEVTLTCTPKAKAYIFNIENLGYLKYKLQNVLGLVSRYSYNLFLYLIDHPCRRRKIFDVPLGELRELFDIPDGNYTEYKYFNRNILKKVCDEINEKTSLKFSYSPVRKGRNVVAIQFDLTDSQDIFNLDKTQSVTNPIIDVAPTNNQLDNFAEDNNYLFDHVDEIFSDEDFLSGN